MAGGSPDASGDALEALLFAAGGSVPGSGKPGGLKFETLFASSFRRALVSRGWCRFEVPAGLLQTTLRDERFA